MADVEGAIAGGVAGLAVGAWMMLRARKRVGPTWADWRGDEPPWEHRWQWWAYSATVAVLLWAISGIGLPDWARAAIICSWGGLVAPFMLEGLRRRVLYSPIAGRLSWTRDLAAAKVSPEARARLDERVRLERESRKNSTESRFTTLGWGFILAAPVLAIFAPADRNITEAVGALAVGAVLLVLGRWRRASA